MARGVVIALAIGIAVLAVLVALAPSIWSWLGLGEVTTVTTTVERVYTTSLTKLITTTKTLEKVLVYTTTLLKPITVTKIVERTTPTTITTIITKPTTLTRVKTLTNTVTTIVTKPITTTVTTTKIIRETTTIEKTMVTTITTTTTTTRVVEKSVVLAAINFNTSFVSEKAGEQVAKWLLKANHSVFGILRDWVMGLPIGKPILEALKALSSRGVNVSLVTEDGDITWLNQSQVKAFCPYVVAMEFTEIISTNVLVIDNKIVVLINDGNIVVAYSPEMAKAYRALFEDVAKRAKFIKPTYCQILERQK